MGVAVGVAVSVAVGVAVGVAQRGPQSTNKSWLKFKGPSEIEKMKYGPPV